MTLSLVVALVVFQSVQAAPTRPVIAGTTPAECVKSLREFVTARQKAAGRMTADLVRQIDQEKTSGARACAAPFDAANVAEQDLVVLVELYTEAAQPDLAKTALDRAVASRALAEPDRAAVLRMAVRMGLREPKSEARNARLEALVDELDRLSPGGTDANVIDAKISAHASMNGYYFNELSGHRSIDTGMIKHSTWLIDTARTFTPELRKKYGYTIALAYVYMAEAWANQGRTDDALALLNRGKADWTDLPNAARAVATEIARYERVGTIAAPIEAPHWLNAPEGMRTLDLTGAVTLLQFTAHWCGPCQASYPRITRLRERFGGRGFRVVLATELYGYFGNEQNLTPEAEIDRDRTYFATHHMDVPIAIDARPTPGRPVLKPGPNRDAVTAIPQIHLIDRQGRIRLIVVGNDEANEPRLAALIEQLLADKTEAR